MATPCPYPYLCPCPCAVGWETWGTSCKWGSYWFLNEVGKEDGFWDSSFLRMIHAAPPASAFPSFQIEENKKTIGSEENNAGAQLRLREERS